jgi:oligosaccharide repeat unit polymerase
VRALSEPRSGSVAREPSGLYPFITWLLAATVSLGVIALWERSVVWIPALAVLATVGSAGAMISTWRGSRDALNPITVIVGIAAVRFGLPAVMELFGSRLQDMSTVRFLHLQRQDWLFGYSIAVTGVAALLLGWQASALTRRSVDPLGMFGRRDLPSAFWASILAAAVGFLALVAFVMTNGISFFTAVKTGVFRGIEVRQGTGVFFHLSLLLIVGSVVTVHAGLARYNRSNRPSLAVFAPVLVSAVAFFVLGGRARAFVAVAGAFLLWWYRPSRDQHVRQRYLLGPSLRSKRTLLVCAPLAMVIFSYLGITYRGTAAPGRGSPVNVEEFGRYLGGTFTVDAGALHSLALASKLPPGVLQGKSFPGNLAFPLSEFVSLPGKSSGVYLTQRFVTGLQPKWGFSATIFGEAYLNFGLLGLVLISGLMGFIFERLYSRFRAGRTSLLVYALFSVYLVRIIFESIEKWPEALTILAMLWVVTRFGQASRDQVQNGVIEAVR